MLQVITLTLHLLISSTPSVSSPVVDPNSIVLGKAPPVLPWPDNLPKAIVRDEGVFLPTELGEAVLRHLVYQGDYYGLCQNAIDAEVAVRNEVMKGDAAECKSKLDAAAIEADSKWPDWLAKTSIVCAVVGGFVLGYELRR